MGRDGSVFSELPARANVSPIGTQTADNETAAAVSLDLFDGCRPGKTIQTDCGRSSSKDCTFIGNASFLASNVRTVTLKAIDL